MDGGFLSIVFALERTNQLSLLPDKDLVNLCPPIEPYQVTKNHKNNYLTNVKNLLFMIAVFINIFSWIIKFWLDCDEDLEHNLLTKDSQASIFRCPKCGSFSILYSGTNIGF